MVMMRTTPNLMMMRRAWILHRLSLVVARGAKEVPVERIVVRAAVRVAVDRGVLARAVGIVPWVPHKL